MENRGSLLGVGHYPTNYVNIKYKDRKKINIRIIINIFPNIIKKNLNIESRIILSAKIYSYIILYYFIYNII